MHYSSCFQCKSNDCWVLWKLQSPDLIPPCGPITSLVEGQWRNASHGIVAMTFAGKYCQDICQLSPGSQLPSRRDLPMHCAYQISCNINVLLAPADTHKGS